VLAGKLQVRVFVASLKSLKKEVGSGSASQRCHRFPTQNAPLHGSVADPDPFGFGLPEGNRGRERHCSLHDQQSEAIAAVQEGSQDGSDSSQPIN
jgi:hypothetical protein